MMKPLTSKGRFYLPIFLFLIILTLNVAAWDTFNYNEDRNPYYYDETATFDSTVTYTNIEDGVVFQPLIIDLDNDGTKEIIGADGNYVKLWQFSGGVIVLDDEWNIGIAQRTPMTSINDVDQDGLIEIGMVVGAANFTIWEYNETSSDFSIMQSWATPATIRNAPVCHNDSYDGLYKCWWGEATGNITRINWNGANGNWSVGTRYNYTNTDVWSTERSLYFTPPVSDVDNDGREEIIMACDIDNDDDEGVCMFDDAQHAAGFTPTFSGDFTSDSRVGGITIYNLDSGARKEIKIETKPRWKPSKEGEEFSGELLRIEDGIYGKDYIIKTASGEELALPNTTVLQTKMAEVKVGDKVYVTYLKEEKGKSGRVYQDFKVEVEE